MACTAGGWLACTVGVHLNPGQFLFSAHAKISQACCLPLRLVVVLISGWIYFLSIWTQTHYPPIFFFIRAASIHRFFFMLRLWITGMRDPLERNGDDSNGRPRWRGAVERKTTRTKTEAGPAERGTLTLTSGANMSQRIKSQCSSAHFRNR